MMGFILRCKNTTWRDKSFVVEGWNRSQIKMCQDNGTDVLFVEE